MMMRQLLTFLFLMQPLYVWAHGDAHIDDPVSIVGDTVTVTLGGVFSMDAISENLSQPHDLDQLTVKITSKPIEGIVSVDKKSKKITYRHGGASSSDDHFSYQLLTHGKKLSNEATITVRIRPVEAAVRIIAPRNGDVIVGNRIVVEYEVVGKDYDHIHVKLDGSHNTVENYTGHYVLEDVVPGKRVITVDLADSRHRAVNSRKASATISVKVVAP